MFTGATMAAATSIDLNPAAIGPGQSSYLYLAATSVIDRYGVRLDHLDPDSGRITPGDTLHDNELGAGGSVAGIFHFGDRAVLAGEFRSAPGETFIANRDQLSYHTLGGGQRTYTVGVGTSIRLTDSIFFGLSLDGGPSYLNLHYARDGALDRGHGAGGIDSDCNGAPCGVGNSLASEHYDVRVSTPLLSTSSLIVNFGFLINLPNNVWFGISYHTPPGLSTQTKFTGTMDVREAPRDGGGLLHGASTVFLTQPASADAELRARLPAQLDLHLGARWEDLSRFQAYDVRGYGSTFATAMIPEWQLRARGFHDPFSVWAGIEQVELVSKEDSLRFGGRIGFETSSLRDELTSPATISPFSYTVDLGAQLHHGPVILQATYGLQYFPSVTVTDSAFDPRSRISCIASNYDYASSACTDVRNGYGIASADGRYDRLEHALRVALIYEIP